LTLNTLKRDDVMKYSVKTEVYKEGLPFNKWFLYECNRKEKVMDIIKNLGFEEKSIGIVIINNKPISTNKILEDRDTVRFVGRIYPEYL
jgi:sulfur carrier protein ThiS